MIVGGRWALFEPSRIERLVPGHEVGDLDDESTLKPMNAPDRLLDRHARPPDAAGVVSEPDDLSVVGLPQLVHLRGEVLKAFDPAVQQLPESFVAVVDGLLHPLGKGVDDDAARAEWQRRIDAI